MENKLAVLGQRRRYPAQYLTLFDRMKHFQMIRIMIPILATCALIASLGSAIVSWQFIRKAKAATGVIVATETKLDDEGNTLYQPTFDFTAAGQTHSVTPSSYVAPSPGAVGKRVPVIYDPRNPSSARINSFVYNWGISTITFLVAIVLGAMHLGICWFRRRFRYVGSNAG